VVDESIPNSLAELRSADILANHTTIFLSLDLSISRCKLSYYSWRYYQVFRTMARDITFSCWERGCIISLYRNLLRVTKGWLSILRH